MSTSVGSTADRAGSDSPSPSPWPWLLALVPPAVWFAHLNASYLLVPVSCRVGHPWWLVAVSIPPALIAAWATVACWRFGREAARPPTDRAGGFTGLLVGSMFLLAIFATTLSNVVVDPCR